jgi:hypothetical protein
LQASRSTVVRSGYGINYTVGLYGTFTQNLAYQPPFAHVEVNLNLPPDITPFPLRGGFGNSGDHGNYAMPIPIRSTMLLRSTWAPRWWRRTGKTCAPRKAIPASTFVTRSPAASSISCPLATMSCIALHEGKTLELHITANNALNVVQYAGVNTQFDSTSNGQVDAFQPMRQITFLARFQF